MKRIAIIYHSGQGHTQFIAQQIQLGAAQIANIEVSLYTAEQLLSMRIAACFSLETKSLKS